MEQKELKDMIKEIVCTILGKKIEIVEDVCLFRYINALEAVYVVMEIEKRTGQSLSGKFETKSDVMTVNGLTKLVL